MSTRVKNGCSRKEVLGARDLATSKIVDNAIVDLTDEDRERISEINNEMGSQAMRDWLICPPPDGWRRY